MSRLKCPYGLTSGPEQRGEATPVSVGELVKPWAIAEDAGSGAC